MVDCDFFLSEYSSLRDGRAAAGLRDALEAHRAACPSCARYDRVVRGGASLLKDTPELRVSDDFAARLEGRLAEVDLEMAVEGRRGQPGTAAATAAVAAGLALAAWLPVLGGDDGGTLPPVSAHAPAAMAAPLYLLELPEDAPAAAPRPGTLATQLSDLGVWKTPYSDLLFRDSPLAVPLAAASAGDPGLALGTGPE